MTRLSRYFLPTTREAPADAEAISHKLIVRAGLARQVGAGLWTFLPAGWRAHRRVEQIVREEMDAIGAGEMLMPVLQPAELWKKSGRYDIDEVFKLEDRRGAELVLAMTHEENLTFHISREVRSYRDLPKLLYHFQTKERDEPRPRAGLLRTREFIMKDAYSFDRDRDGLDASYELFIEAYDRIFDRSGLEWYRVESRRGDDGRLRRPRVHGALRGRRERRGALRLRLRGERGDRERRRRSRWRACPSGSDAPERGRDARGDDRSRPSAGSSACRPGRSSRRSRCSWRSAGPCWS